MIISTFQTTSEVGRYPKVAVTETKSSAMRIRLQLDINNSIYFSLEEAKIVFTQLDLSLREAYDDIAVRDEA